jgi:hypothetical protein
MQFVSKAQSVSRKEYQPGHSSTLTASESIKGEGIGIERCVAARSRVDLDNELTDRTANPRNRELGFASGDI